VAAAWVMAETTGSPLMVAAVQSATTLPVVVLAIIAGTLADVVDRRCYLLLAQLWMLLTASGLALLAHFGQVGPWTLVLFSFSLGIGAAMSMPAQQATTPELVPRSMLGSAVALGSLSVTIARSIGPALGGLIVAHAGVAWAFTLNAFSFLGMLIVLLHWRREPNTSTLPPESFGSALRAGFRYAAQASVFQAVLVRAAAFFLFASALTALLPIIVKQDLQAGAMVYGLLLGCIGIGAIGGAVLLPQVRKRMGADQLVLLATLAYAGCMVALALVRSIPVLAIVSFVNGFAWITVLSSLQVAAQTSVPAWVRARSLSLYIVVFSAGMAVGSLGWGALAQLQSNALALIVAAVGTVIAALFTRRFRLGAAASLDVMPSGHWPEPVQVDDIDGDRGPVLVTVEYEIALDRREDFLLRMQPLGRSRRRDGAFEWGVVEDTARPGVYLEYFLAASWLEHRRQHERVTNVDRRLQESVHELHIGPLAPVVRHLVGGSPRVALSPMRDQITG
jgi:MFS family permease